MAIIKHLVLALLLCFPVMASDVYFGSDTYSAFYADIEPGEIFSGRWVTGSDSLITDTFYIRAYDKSDGDDTVMAAIYNDSINGADTTMGSLHCECSDSIIITASAATTYSVVFPSCTLQAATAYWLVIKNYNRLAANTAGIMKADDDADDSLAAKHIVKKFYFGGKDSTNLAYMTNHNTIRFMKYACPLYGTADSISAFLTNTAASGSVAAKYAVYETDSSLVDVTAEGAITGNGGTYTWIPLAMTAVDTLVRATNYMLTSWAADPGFPTYVARIRTTNKTTSANRIWYKALTYDGSFPSPATELTVADYHLKIYAVMTEIPEYAFWPTFVNTNTTYYALNAVAGPHIRIAGTILGGSGYGGQQVIIIGGL